MDVTHRAGRTPGLLLLLLLPNALWTDVVNRLEMCVSTYQSCCSESSQRQPTFSDRERDQFPY
jgi:hypothetical protein